MSRRTQPRASLVLFALAAALAGCDEDALRPPPSSSAHASRSSAPAARSTSPVAASAAISNDAWTAIARSPDAFELYPLRGALFVDAAGFLAILGDGPLRQSPAVMRGLEKGASGRLLGAYPSGAWLVASDAAYRWTGERWSVEPLLREHESLLDLVAWDDGRALAAIALPGNDMRFAQAGGKPAATLPVPAPADPHAAAHRDEASPGEEGEKETPCRVRMKPRGVVLAGLPGGELVAAGYACEPIGHGAAIVERWGPKQAEGTVEALPKSEGGRSPTIAGVVARSAKDVLVYGSVDVSAAPYLARFDGVAWSLEAVPFGAAIETLAAADDGTLWAAVAGTVWKKAGDAPWVEVPLPAGLVTHAAWPRPGSSPAEVWVAAREREGKTRAVLLRTAHGPAPDLVHLPPRNAMAGAIATSRRFFATAACDKVFAELDVAGPSRDAATGKPLAPPKDFAAVRPLLTGELAGFEPVVEDDGAHFVIGVLLPRRDLARKLVAAYEDRHPKAPAGISCHEPELAKTK